MSEIDVLLYRPIKDGRKYDKLIPKSNCTKTFAGNGMTDFSVKAMSDMVKISLIDTAAIAPLFKQRSLQLTCAEIHYFCYNYFQYKADGAKQYLRSPACSWKMRQDGIDCKSYSIIASSILMNLGLIHYIRQVKQPGYKPDMWTHVYVVVPVDQKTGSLSQGHYTIDGTIAMLDEPMYIQKSDLKMSMEHYALRGAVPHTNSEGLAISFGDVKKFFASGWAPSCIGGTHDMKDFEDTIKTITPWFDDIVYSINDGIRNNKPVFDLVNTLLLNTQQIKAHSEHYAEYNWNSKCSKDATKAYADLGLWYYNMIFQAFMPWLEQYFNISYKTVAGIKKGDYIPASKFTKTSFNGGTIEVKQIASMTLKSNVSEIKKFEFTPYVMGTKVSDFNFLQFVSGLTTTLASFGNGSSNTPTKTISINSGSGGLVKVPANSLSTIKPVTKDLITRNPSGTDKTTTASLGILGWGLLATAGYYTIQNIRKSSTKKAK